MMIIRKLINILKESPKHKANYILSYLYSIGGGRFKGTNNNVIHLKNTYYRGLRITIEGTGNIIEFSEGANYVKHTSISIFGNNNHIIFGERNYVEGSSLYIEDDNCNIIFGNHNKIYGFTHIAAIEGQSVIFGDGCLFSDNVVFRTGDSHSILDNKTGKRINPSKSITVGNNVWFGNTTIILKGVTIDDDSIIGTGSIVTKSIPKNVIVAGNPAHIVKEGVRWELQRIPVDGSE